MPAILPQPNAVYFGLPWRRACRVAHEAADHHGVPMVLMVSTPHYSVTSEANARRIGGSWVRKVDPRTDSPVTLVHDCGGSSPCSCGVEP
jgi:hypothetical protein